MNIIKLDRDIRASHEAVGEFTLPDYLPAVSRLLCAECEIIPEGVYLKENGSGIQAQLGGVAVFRVTWCADASEEQAGVNVWQTALSCDYETAVNMDGAAQPLYCRVKSEPENVWCRVTAPRRLSLRCRIGSRVTAVTPADISSDIGCADAERLCGEIEAASLLRGSAGDLMCSCDIGGIAQSERPISCTASLRVAECKPVNPTECRVRGDIIVRCLVAGTDGMRETEDVIRFDESVDFVSPDNTRADEYNTSPDAAGSNDSAPSTRAGGRVTSLSFTHDGSGTRAEVMYELEAESVSQMSAPVVYDAYSCSSPSEAEYGEAEYLSRPAAVVGNFTLNECTSLPAGVGASRVESVSAAAKITGSERERGKLVLTGTLSGNVLLSDGVQGGEIEAVPYTVPWKYETGYELPDSAGSTDGKLDADNIVVWGDASAGNVSARVDMRRQQSEGLCIEAEIFISATAALCESCRILTRLKCDPSLPDTAKNAAGAVITVCYPTADETLWDIAKQHRVPRSRCSVFGDAELSAHDAAQCDLAGKKILII